MSTDAGDLIGRMSKEEFDRLVLHLGNYALRESKRYYWRTGDSVELPGGETVESIVYLAIEKTITGERNWDSQKDPDFKKYLMDVIDSLLNHLATGKENTMLTAVPEVGSDDRKDWETGAAKRTAEADWLARQTATPEEELLEKEAAERDGQLRDRAIGALLESSKDDKELTFVIEAMLDGYDKPGEIANVTGIDIRDVYNVMKRLNRKIAVIRKQLREAA